MTLNIPLELDYGKPMASGPIPHPLADHDALPSAHTKHPTLLVQPGLIVLLLKVLIIAARVVVSLCREAVA